jgi:hypothetical protein
VESNHKPGLAARQPDAYSHVVLPCWPAQLPFSGQSNVLLLPCRQSKEQRASSDSNRVEGLSTPTVRPLGSGPLIFALSPTAGASFAPKRLPSITTTEATVLILRPLHLRDLCPCAGSYLVAQQFRGCQYLSSVYFYPASGLRLRCYWRPSTKPPHLFPLLAVRAQFNPPAVTILPPIGRRGDGGGTTGNGALGWRQKYTARQNPA